MPEERTRSESLQRLCARVGSWGVLVLFVALFGTGALPPPSPADGPQQLVDSYFENEELVLAGLVVGFMAFGFYAALTVSIFMQLLRIEGRRPVMSFLQLGSGLGCWLFLSIPMLVLVAAGFRVDRDPETTQAMVDLAFVLFVIPVAPFLLQYLALASVILGDESEEPVYPRWVAWANIAIVISFVPALGLAFVKDGPLAYNDVFPFGIPVVTFGLWMLMMGVMTRRAVDQEVRRRIEAERAVAPEADEREAALSA